MKWLLALILVAIITFTISDIGKRYEHPKPLAASTNSQLYARGDVTTIGTTSNSLRATCVELGPEALKQIKELMK